MPRQASRSPLALGAAACGSGNATSTDSAGKPVVKIMVGGLDKQIYLPAMLAQQLGYYAQQGLNVQLSDEPAGVTPKPTCSPARSTAVAGFYDHNIDLQAKGKQTEEVVQLLQVPGEVELCRNDQQGRSTRRRTGRASSLGITDLGSSTDFLTQYLAVQQRCRGERHPRTGRTGRADVHRGHAAQERSTAA